MANTQKIPIINILTYRLPFDLANQIYNEYQSRLKDAVYKIDNYKTYRPLSNAKPTVELMLALSIFHKRVITNFDGAIKFYNTVTRSSEATVISIGNFKLDDDEKNKLLAVVLNYRQLLERFSIQQVDLEYLETGEFLRKIISLKKDLEYGERNRRPRKAKGSEGEEEDVPF